MSLFLFEYKFSTENRDSMIIFIYFCNRSIMYNVEFCMIYEGGVRRLFELKEDCDWKKIILNSLKLFKFHVNDDKYRKMKIWKNYKDILIFINT